MKTISENKSEENWAKLINKLREGYDKNFFVDDRSMIIPKDRCFKGALRKVFIDHGREMSFFISHVIQCYTIYFSNPHPELNSKKETFPKDLDHITSICDEELKEVNMILKNEIEEHFKGYSEFPIHLLGIEIDDICYDGLGHPYENSGLLFVPKMTFFNAFFSNFISN